MPYIRLVEPDEVPPDIQKVFESGEAQYGQVLNTWRAIAHNPEIFGSYLPYIRAIFAPGALDQRIKDLSAVYVAILNHCRYTVSHRVYSARQKNIPEQDMIGLLNIENHPYSPAEKAAFNYTYELTTQMTAVSYKDNKQAVSSPVLDELKRHFSDAEISELTISVGLWNALTRFHRVMDFELDMPEPPRELDEVL